MGVLTLPKAAAALGVSPRTLGRWIDAGAPVARRGRRGRGDATLIDPAAVRAWRRAQGGADALRAFAGRVPELLAIAHVEAYEMAHGPKAAAAANTCATWYLSAMTLLDALRAEVPDIGELQALPVEIERLRKIGNA